MTAPLDPQRKSFLAMKTQMQYPRFLREEIQKIADDVILKPIHSLMRDFGYSEKIISGTKIQNIEVGRNGTLSFDVVSD